MSKDSIWKTSTSCISFMKYTAKKINCVTDEGASGGDTCHHTPSYLAFFLSLSSCGYNMTFLTFGFTESFFAKMREIGQRGRIGGKNEPVRS